MADGAFMLGLRFPRVALAIEQGRRWWRPYGPETPADKVKALSDACAYFYGSGLYAIEERDRAQAAIKAVTDLCTASSFIEAPAEARFADRILRTIDDALSEGQS